MRYRQFFSDLIRQLVIIAAAFALLLGGIGPLYFLKQVHDVRNEGRFITVSSPITFQGPISVVDGWAMQAGVVEYSFVGYGTHSYSGEFRYQYPVGNTAAAITEDRATGRVYDSTHFIDPGATPLRPWQYAFFGVLALVLAGLAWLGCMWLAERVEEPDLLSDKAHELWKSVGSKLTPRA